MPKAKSVAEYIAAASPAARPMLRQLRAAVKAAAPKATEGMSYGMPYYSHKGRLVYFAAFKNHVSLFSSTRVLRAHAAMLTKFKTSKATLQFPIGTRVPVTVVKRIVKAVAQANEASKR
ncbi:MAG: iron chaperone [Candidatus Eiseniibacteriota bacterium]